jgi:hypothetical protein
MGTSHVDDQLEQARSIGSAHDIDPSGPSVTSWEAYLAWVTPRWDALLASHPAEPAVQDFLERNPAYLPGVNQYGSGHHSPHGGVVLTQPQLKGLRQNRLPDFMWIGATSDLVTPVLIEIEKPGKKWFNSKRECLASDDA